MTCLSTLRGTWPFSICSKDDSDEEEWPPPWPKISENPKKGYSKTREMTVTRPDFNITHPVSPATPLERKMHRVKTSKDRLPPVPTLPEEYYGLPPDSRARSQSQDSRKRGRSRNRLVKSRSNSTTRSKSRPAIGTPSDFRKVAGATSTIPRAEPMPPRRDSWRRILRRQSRRTSFRPLELSIYQPGNELKPLPRFSRLILDPGRKSFLMEGSSRPLSEMPKMPISRFSTMRQRSTRSRKPSRSPSKKTLTPRVPFAQDSFDDASSDISFDDLESVVDPDFNPVTIKNRSRAQSMKANPHTLQSTLEPVRPPPPLKTRSLLPSPRDDKSFVSPQSPAARTIITQSLKLDDLPSAFSSPSSPHPPISWPIPPGQYGNPEPPRSHPPVHTTPSVPYAQIRLEREATPDQAENDKPAFQSQPRDVVDRKGHSPTPSNSSSVNTAMTGNTYSDRSSSTAPTAPPSPPQPKQNSTEIRQPGPRPFSKRPVPPAPTHLREISMQRVAAETPLLQPVPLIPMKSPKRFMSQALEEPSLYTQQISVYHVETLTNKTPANTTDQNRLTQWPSTMQTAYANYQHQQQIQLQQLDQLEILKKDEPVMPPQPVAPLQWQSPINAAAASPQRPQLHIETKTATAPGFPNQQYAEPSQPQPSGWTQAGSAWREVVWSLKRRTQEEAVLQMREQQVEFDAVSAHSDMSEASQAPWAQKQQRRAQHSRGGSGDKGSAGSYSSGAHSRSTSANSNNTNVMEVPVALTLGAADAGREMSLSAEASNAALLQMQPVVRHDMHAIAEESEEEDSAPMRQAMPAPRYNQRTTTSRTAPPRIQAATNAPSSRTAVQRSSSAPAAALSIQKTLSVVNGMPEDDSSDSDSDSSDDDYESDDDVQGEWEIVHSTPASARQSLARHGSALVPNATLAAPRQAPAPPFGVQPWDASRWSHSTRTSDVAWAQQAAAPASARSSAYSVLSSGGRASQLPTMQEQQRRSRSVPREVAEGRRRGGDDVVAPAGASNAERGRSRSSSSSRSVASSRGSMFIPPGFDLATAAAGGMVPPMPPVPAQVPAPKPEQQRAIKIRQQQQQQQQQQQRPTTPSRQWGRGIGSEFGVAY